MFYYLIFGIFVYMQKWHFQKCKEWKDVSIHSEESYFYTVIQTRCKRHDFSCSSNIPNVKSLMLKKNLQLKTYVANTLNCSVSTVIKIVNSDLNQKRPKDMLIVFFSVMSMNVEHVDELFMKNF